MQKFSLLLCKINIHSWRKVEDSLGSFGMGLEWFECFICNRCEATHDRIRSDKSHAQTHINFKHINEWHRYFCLVPTLAQTENEFRSCTSGTKVCWLKEVWRQDIVRGTYYWRAPIYRYVDMDKCPY